MKLRAARPGGAEAVEILTIIPGEPREPEKVTVPAGAEEPEDSVVEPDDAGDSDD